MGHLVRSGLESPGGMTKVDGRPRPGTPRVVCGDRRFVIQISAGWFGRPRLSAST